MANEIELNIDMESYKNTLESMSDSDLKDYQSALSKTIRQQTIKYTRSLFLIGQRMVNGKWYTDNMTNVEHDLNRVVKTTYDTYDSRTREFVREVTNVSYPMDDTEIEFSAILKAKGYMFDGDVSKITDHEQLMTIINERDVQIDSIMNGADTLKPLVNAHKEHQRERKIVDLEVRLIASKNSTVELAKLRLKQTIVKHIVDTNSVKNIDDVKDRVAKYRAMYSKVEHVETVHECETVTPKDDATHIKIVNGKEVHKHEGIKGYHPITRVHKSK
jgi:hypothetical protein